MQNMIKKNHKSIWTTGVMALIAISSTWTSATYACASVSCTGPEGSTYGANPSPDCKADTSACGVAPTYDVLITGTRDELVGPSSAPVIADFSDRGASGPGPGGGGGGGGGGSGIVVEVEVIGLKDVHPEEFDFEKWRDETHDEYIGQMNYISSVIQGVRGNSEAAGRERYNCESKARDFERGCKVDISNGKQAEIESCDGLVDSVSVAYILGVSTASNQTQCLAEAEAAYGTRTAQCEMYAGSISNGCGRITAN